MSFSIRRTRTLRWPGRLPSDELNDINGWRDWVLGTTVVIVIGAALLLGLLSRAAITRPIAALAAACRRITEGSFDETISPPRRPKDIRNMAIDVENMRKRIVEELAVSQGAQAQLDEQAAELRRSNTELEQFAYVASHDLQEPLRKVASFCQLLEKRYGDKLDERGIEYIGFAVDGAKRMQALINDLLTFSRVGRLGTTETEVQLDATLDAGLANLAVAIEETDAEIVRPAQPLPQIVGDPMLLTMLWQNLVGNAIKFRHKDRRPRIAIDCAPGTGTHDGQWLLSVADNGIGIPEEFSDKVFVIFQRLHGRDVYAGTGVGLALGQEDHRAPRRHRPDRHVLHRWDAIRIHAAHARTRRRSRLGRFGRSASMTTPEGRAIDILLVEDDPGDELITREAFEHNKLKNRLHVAHDGEEGLNYLYRRGEFADAPRPDLILLDLNLPKYDGRQLLEKIKSDPDLARIPVVVLTTSSAEEDILKSYKLHANAYVTKPVDLDQFMKAVRQIDEFFVQVVRLPGNGA